MEKRWDENKIGKIEYFPHSDIFINSLDFLNTFSYQRKKKLPICQKVTQLTVM